jgi:transformation/transcription domain-associated protein
LTLAVLQALVQKKPASLEDFAGNLSKMFGKGARECIQIPPPQQPHAPGQTRQINELATRTAKALLEIWQVQMPISSEHRKSILFTLQGLVEKSVDVTVCRLILDICRERVFARHDGFPATREKAGAKMICLEYKRFEEPILVNFLNLILNVYN